MSFSRLVIGLVAASLIAPCIASAQTDDMAVDRELRDRVNREVRNVIVGATDYANICSKLRALNDRDRRYEIEIPLFTEPFDARDKKFVDALLEYCLFGRISLNNSERDGQCKNRDNFVLERRHIRALEQLPAMNAAADGYVRLDCVRLDRNLRLVDLKASRIVFNSVDAGEILIGLSKVPHGIWIQDSTIRKSLLIFELETQGAIELNGTSIGRDKTSPHALIAYAMQVGRVIVSDVDIFGSVLFLSSSVADDVIWRRNRKSVNSPAHTIDFDRLKVGGKFELAGFDSDDKIRLETMQLERLTARTVQMSHVLIQSSMFARGLKVDLLELDDTTTNGDFNVRKAEIGHVFVQGSTIRSFLGDDSKFRTFELAGGNTFAELYCTDCAVEQYVALLGRFKKVVSLQGARIGNSLIFSFDGNRASWDPGAELRLTNTQVRVVEADDADLRINGEGKCRDQLVDVNLSGFSFEYWGGGRKTAADTTSRGIFERPADEITRWIVSGKSCPTTEKRCTTGNVDPQPFETFATVLERSGRADRAMELRIAKRDAQIAAACYSFFERGVFRLGRDIVGYGYDNKRALVWVLGAIILGTLIHFFGRKDWPDNPLASLAFHLRRTRNLIRGKPLPKSEQPASAGRLLDRLSYSVFFSLDRFVPSLSLDQAMGDYGTLYPLPRYYFYIHRAFGTIIITYAVAGLTGLLK